MPFQLRDFTLILPWVAMTKKKTKDQETKTPTMLHLPPGVKRQLEAAAGAAGNHQRALFGPESDCQRRIATRTLRVMR
jgi:hypothetical protein